MIKLKIALAVFTAIVVLNGIYFYYGKSVQKTYEVERIASGTSMEPTIKDGETTINIYGVEPKENDIVSLVCDNYRCTQDLSDNILYKQEHQSLIKRLIRIDENDCHWLEGDNKEASYDSRDFGWICPEDRHAVGIVKVP